MKIKIKTIAKLKEELDRVFSEYIRTREMDEYGGVTCFTCGKKDHFRKMQCGHYWSRSIMSLRYDEINCNVQCVSCNIFKEGNKPAYSLALQRKYGNDILNNLELRSKNLNKMDRFAYNILINNYREKCKSQVVS